MRTLAVFLSLFLVSCSADREGLARLCRTNGQIQVHDPAGWQAYVRALQAWHSVHGGGTNLRGNFLMIWGVEGFNFANDFTRGEAKVRDWKPYRNDVYITRRGQPVATVVNYNLSWDGIDSKLDADCVHDYPEVYGVRAVPPSRSD